MSMTIEQQALALVNEVRKMCSRPPILTFAQAQASEIEAAFGMTIAELNTERTTGEAFRQEVNEAVKDYFGTGLMPGSLSRFIIAPPVDPLVEALREALQPNLLPEKNDYAQCLRAALAKHGLKIAPIMAEDE